MSAIRDELPQLQYWRATPERRAQRFYVALCLLVASVQDAFLGAKEREQQNLSWSATCSYYSLLHSARLLSFLALGDYPMNHAPLRRLFAEAGGGFQCDWLAGLRTRIGDHSFVYPTDYSARPQELRSFLDWHLSFLGLEGRRVPLGRLLQAAGTLRNDANYEALLIANEQQHAVVTPAFVGMADGMNRSARQVGVPHSIEAFRAFVRLDPDLAEERLAFRALLHDYLHSHAAPELGRKLSSVPHLAEESEELVLGIEPEPFQADYGHLETAFSRGTFEGKTTLMDKFRNKVATLQQALESGWGRL